MSTASLDTDGTHAVPLGVQLSIGTLVSVIGCGSTWWTAHNSSPSDADNEHRRRDHLLQLRLHQTALLATNAVYLACIILSCWNASGVGLDINQILGIFAWLLTVAAGFWLTVSTYVPYFENYVLRHKAVLSVLSASTHAFATAVSVICGVLAPAQGQDGMLLMAFHIMLGNQPTALAVPQCLCYALGAAAWSCSTQSYAVAQQALLRTAGVASAGIVLAAVQGFVLPNQSSKAPSSMFAVTLAVTELYRLLDQLLRTRRIAQALLPSLADGRALSIVLQPLASEQSAFSLKQPYMTVALLLLYLLHNLVSLVGPLVHGSGGKPSPWLQFARQNPLLQPVCTYIEALSTAKQQAVAFVAVMMVLQVLSSVALVVSLPIYGLARFVQAAPVVLLGVMMGFVVQACTIMYLVITAPPTSSGLPVESATDTQDVQGRHRAKSMEYKKAIAMEADMSFEKASMIKKMGLHNYLESMPADKAPLQDNVQSRVSALANFQVAVQSLESQGVGLEQEDFIRASRGVIKAVFPGVFQSSISYVTSSYQSVDVFTVVGVGSNLPPRLNMPVAPGTLLKYVLETGNPLFMPSTQDFVGPFSDVQFLAMALRLQSLAVLPLLYQGAELVGVLLLGYDVPSTWIEQDTALARQMSMVLAHASTLMNMDAGYDATLRQWYTRPGVPAAGGYGTNSTIPASWYRPGSAAQMQAAAGAPSYGRGSISQWEPDELGEAGGPGGGGGEDDASNVQLEGALRDLKVLEIIGRGGFGSVYKGIWRSQVVAVKVLEHGDELVGCSDDLMSSGGSDDAEDANSRKAALLEGAVTSALDHPAIVRTFDYHVISVAQSKGADGSVRRGMQQTQIVMEFCDRGCLQDAIDQGVFYSGGSRRPGGAAPAPDTTAAADVAVDMEALLMTLGEVAGALQYLHTHCITHRDLKPKNILLKSSAKDRRGFSAKVSDFGLSQVQRADEGTHVSSKYSGTITHMPPELIEDGKVYPMGDVYAFGIIMWEIYTGASPYSNMTRPQIMVGVVTHNLRPKFPESCPDWYKQLAYHCWRKDPRQRPSFGDVAAEVQELLLTRAKPDARGR